VIEDPRDLRPAEVRIEHEAGARAKERFVARALQLATAIGGAAILPDDRAMDRLAARALPHDRRLALVRDPDADAFLRIDTAAAYAPTIESTTLFQISSGSCSTHPGCGSAA